MLNKMSAKNLFYSLIVTGIGFAIIGLITDSVQTMMDIVTIVSGLIVLLRPTMIYEVLRESNAKKDLASYSPIISEKTAKLLGFFGGLVLLSIGIGSLIFK